MWLPELSLQKSSRETKVSVDTKEEIADNEPLSASSPASSCGSDLPTSINPHRKSTTSRSKLNGIPTKRRRNSNDHSRYPNRGSSTAQPPHQPTVGQSALEINRANRRSTLPSPEIASEPTPNNGRVTAAPVRVSLCSSKLLELYRQNQRSFAVDDSKCQSHRKFATKCSTVLRKLHRVLP